MASSSPTQLAHVPIPPEPGPFFSFDFFLYPSISFVFVSPCFATSNYLLSFPLRSLSFAVSNFYRNRSAKIPQILPNNFVVFRFWSINWKLTDSMLTLLRFWSKCGFSHLFSLNSCGGIGAKLRSFFVITSLLLYAYEWFFRWVYDLIFNVLWKFGIAKLSGIMINVFVGLDHYSIYVCNYTC